MSTSNQPDFDTVLSNNPYNGTYYLRSGNKLSETHQPHFSKKQYSISYLNTGDFITTQVNVSKNIPEEDLAFVIETKVYEELALDMAIDYTVGSIEVPGGDNTKERIFHAFIVDPLVIDETYAHTVSAIQYIDRIVPVPLLLKNLYSREIVQGYGAHCYIYFQENDAFFTLYDNQDFVYTKSLKYSFKEMHERFCELIGEQIDPTDFRTLLAVEGLGTKKADYQTQLIKLFGELFLHINDVLNYAKRAFEIETIEEIYIGSQIGVIAGLDEYCQTYLGFEAKTFDFDYGFATEGYVDQVHQLLQIYVDLDPQARYEVNFSSFHRPPPFFQRHSGRLFAVTALALVGAFAYPVTYWTLGYIESARKMTMEQTYRETHAIKVTRERTLNLKLAQKVEAQELYDAEAALFDERKATLMKIHDVKVNYPMKGKIIAALTRDLNRYGVGVSKVTFHQNDLAEGFTLSVMAKKDKEITDLVEFLTENRTQQFHYDIETIAFDENDRFYRGELKVTLK